MVERERERRTLLLMMCVAGLMCVVHRTKKNNGKILHTHFEPQTHTHLTTTLIRKFYGIASSFLKGRIRSNNREPMTLGFCM